MARRRRAPQRGAKAAGEATLVAEAEGQILRIGQKLGALIARLEAGELGAAAEVGPAIAALDKALGAVLHERQKSGHEGGDAAGGELDLEAARAEVQRRMDRLRATLDPDALSDGPE